MVSPQISGEKTVEERRRSTGRDPIIATDHVGPCGPANSLDGPCRQMDIANNGDRRQKTRKENEIFYICFLEAWYYSKKTKNASVSILSDRID
jgi:hypothetical protein